VNERVVEGSETYEAVVCFMRDARMRGEEEIRMEALKGLVCVLLYLVITRSISKTFCSNKIHYLVIAKNANIIINPPVTMQKYLNIIHLVLYYEINGSKTQLLLIAK